MFTKTLLGGFFWLSLAVNAYAQLGTYNPYTQEPTIANPILPDGKLVWPSFYKSARTYAKYQDLFACGTCYGTGKRVGAILEENKVNINTLGEGSVTGYCLAITPGICTLVDATGKATTLVTHPMNVTKISVVGSMPYQQLTTGLTVRFLAKVNDKNSGIDALEALDVFTPNAETKIPAVKINHLQTFIGTIYKWDPKSRRLTLATDKTHRYLFTLAENAQVNVDGSTLNLIAPDDQISAKGQVYNGEGTGASVTIFASKIEVKKATRLPKTKND